jgi:hypothetical protein
MKCSHGLPFEMKCRQCFEDAMKRVSASQSPLSPVVTKPEVVQGFVLGDSHQRAVDSIRGLS